MKSAIIGIVLLVVIGFSVIGYGQVAWEGGTRTVRTDGSVSLMMHEFFRSCNVSGLYGTVGVYNEAGGTSSASSWVRVSDYLDNMDYEIVLPVMPASGTVTVTLEGRIGNTGTGSVILERGFSGTASNYYTPVTERPEYVRTKVICDAVGSERVSVRLKCANKIGQ